MALYIVLINWTDQGIKVVKDSPKRADTARDLATKLGCTMKELYLTMGNYDLVTMVEAPDDETMARFGLTLASAGNIRTTTLRALSEDSYRKIISSI